jgi:hypothetical protein
MPYKELDEENALMNLSNLSPDVLCISDDVKKSLYNNNIIFSLLVAETSTSVVLLVLICAKLNCPYKNVNIKTKITIDISISTKVNAFLLNSEV